ncbi:elongation factor G [Thermohalobacter berrensis]|uniref:Elongation factor G n=1 Tax=Thermohalobacter berrensis TaxID=99594 RepID=A0A419T875_9FIRM|nr:elongation factor G [Thermohalobacter berrensis]RKD33754.1 translation elongation factor G [Thermohalobacter berrensis]
MKIYETDKIRNVTLLGHGGSGKTTLTEAMLFTTGVTKRIGKVEDGNTVSDFEKEEKERQYSINTSIIPVEWKDHKLNTIDTPGYFDFVGEIESALKVAAGAVIVVDASSGVEVGTEKAWQYTRREKIPTLIFINKMDKENVNFDKVLNELREKFGKKVVPFEIPLGEKDDFRGLINIVDMNAREYNEKEIKCFDTEIPDNVMDKIEPLREMLIESVAESDEELFEKYFAGEEFTDEEIHRGLRAGVINGDLVPVLCGAASKNIGVQTLMDMIWDYLPAPKDIVTPVGVNPENEEPVERNMEANEPFSALVFKTIADPYVGKISLFKVLSGELKKDDEILNSTQGNKLKINHLYVIRGKEQIEVSKIIAGDIGAVTKLNDTYTGDTLCCMENPIKYSGIEFPEPVMFLAVEPKSESDEEKMSNGLQKLSEEDPSFKSMYNRETKQTLIGGQGDIHLSVITSRLKNKFGVEVELVDPKVPYRETIKGRAEAEGKHKKQTGGHGQYGHVFIRFEPSQEEFQFDEEIFGGAVPKQYIPAVEKGLKECFEEGILAGYPVVNVKATLYDGSYHSVDSSELAFKMATALAYKKGMKEAKPILLEPIMNVEVLIPEDYMGDIMGDLNKRRGRILGMEPQKDGKQLIRAEVPQAEMFKYASDLRSMTQARGSFKMEFSRYEEVPGELTQKIIEQAKKEK